MTLEQTRAVLAYRHVAQVGEDFAEGSAERKSYGSFACKLPALLRSAGLCQTVHFLKSRNKETASRLLAHLAEQLHRIDAAIAPLDAPARLVEALCKQAREAELASYVWLSREAVAAATWYARLAKSELGYEPGEEGEA